MRDAYPTPPNLQDLVAEHGGYDKIKPAAWADFDKRMAAWHRARRIHAVGYVFEELPKPVKRRFRRKITR
jgi:hypothetical protein